MTHGLRPLSDAHFPILLWAALEERPDGPKRRATLPVLHCTKASEFRSPVQRGDAIHLSERASARRFQALKFRKSTTRRRPCGLKDKQLVFGTRDCRFESCKDHRCTSPVRKPKTHGTATSEQLLCDATSRGLRPRALPLRERRPRAVHGPPRRGAVADAAPERAALPGRVGGGNSLLVPCVSQGLFGLRRLVFLPSSSGGTPMSECKDRSSGRNCWRPRGSNPSAFVGRIAPRRLLCRTANWAAFPPPRARLPSSGHVQRARRWAMRGSLRLCGICGGQCRHFPLWLFSFIMGPRLLLSQTPLHLMCQPAFFGFRAMWPRRALQCQQGVARRFRDDVPRPLLPILRVASPATLSRSGTAK